MDKSLFSYIWRHSWREQLVIFAVVIVSLPFFFMSLDLPKRIVNDAIQGRAFKDGHQVAKVFDFTLTMPSWLGGAQFPVYGGVDLNQMQLLLALSCVFLGFVLVNGAFKYWINLAKGALGERMLRRLRFDLVTLLFRFTPATLRSVKSSEIATIVKDEVEPIGGFIGDAFVLPLLLITQAATAMIFILLQSVWLGILAGGVVLIQLIVIPRLRREQLRLGKERQLASRKLAGRVGEIVDGMEVIHIHDARRWERAEIGDRLYTLFDLRFRLFKRKFVVKYLNNMLAQITPFFFYSIGGYFALTGRLDIGQLVAVIGAYRELPPPLKELIDWDQMRLDVQIKYDQVVQQFSPDELLPIDADAEADAAAAVTPLDGSKLSVTDVRVSDPHGGFVIENVSFEAVLPATIGVFGEGGGPSTLARVIARVDSASGGLITLGSNDITKLPQQVLRRTITYAGGDAILFPGSLRENLLYGVRRSPDIMDAGDASERKRRVEAERTGNPIDDPRLDWTDYASLGSDDNEALDRMLLDIMTLTGLRWDVYRFGLSGRIGMTLDEEMTERIVAARQALRDVLAEQNMLRLVEPFDPDAYNTQSTIVENILFGVPVDGGSARRFIEGAQFRRVLADTRLLPELERLGEKIAVTMTEIFRGLPPGHSLFEQFSFIAADDLDDYEDILRRRAGQNLTAADRHRLVLLTLDYVEPRHRLGLINDEISEMVLAARRRFRELSENAKSSSAKAHGHAVEFYDPTSVCAAAPLRDNLLFGRVAFGIANAEARVTAALTKVVDDLGLREAVERIGLGHQVGPGGRMLTPQQRARANLARCLIKKPALLVYDQALAVLGEAEAGNVLARVVAASEGRSLLVCGRLQPPDIVFDVTITFDGTHANVQQKAQAQTPDRFVKEPTS